MMMDSSNTSEEWSEFSEFSLMFSLSASISKVVQNAISEHLFCKNFLGDMAPDSHALYPDCGSRNAICSDIIEKPRLLLLYAIGFQSSVNRNS